MKCSEKMRKNSDSNDKNYLLCLKLLESHFVPSYLSHFSLYLKTKHVITLILIYSFFYFTLFSLLLYSHLYFILLF